MKGRREGGTRGAACVGAGGVADLVAPQGGEQQVVEQAAALVRAGLVAERVRAAADVVEQRRAPQALLEGGALLEGVGIPEPVRPRAEVAGAVEKAAVEVNLRADERERALPVAALPLAHPGCPLFVK